MTYYNKLKSIAYDFARHTRPTAEYEELTMRKIRVTFEDGNLLFTSINGTPESILDYYIGQYFNLGNDEDKLAKAVSVAFFDGEYYLTHKRQAV